MADNFRNYFLPNWKESLLVAAHSEDFVIIADNFLIMLQGATDRRTERQTDASSIAKTCYSIICCRLFVNGLRSRSSICIAHRRKHASNALSSLTRAACRTATVCSLQTQAGAAPARQRQSAVPRSPFSVTHVNELLLILPSHGG